jgi:hypothetical protein
LEEDMDFKDLQQFYINFMKEEGFVTKIDEQGDIAFKYQGDDFFLGLEEDDETFFRLGWLSAWGSESDEEKLLLLIAASKTNAEMKFTKTFILNEDVIFVTTDMLVDIKNFKVDIKRLLDAIVSTVETFKGFMTEDE